jgi:hypothetical protein
MNYIKGEQAINHHVSPVTGGANNCNAGATGLKCKCNAKNGGALKKLLFTHSITLLRMVLNFYDRTLSV